METDESLRTARADIAEEMRAGQDIALRSNLVYYDWNWDILRNRNVPVWHSEKRIPFDVEMEIVEFKDLEIFGECQIPEEEKYARWKGPDMFDGRDICIKRWQVYNVMAEQNRRSILILDDFRLFGWVGPEYLEGVECRPMHRTRQ